MVYNDLATEKPTLICKIKGTGDKYKTEVNFNTAPSLCIVYLYNAEYDFNLENAKLFYKNKADGTGFHESETYFGLGSEACSAWTTEPVFFIIVYDKAEKKVIIKPNYVSDKSCILSIPYRGMRQKLQ